VTDRREFVRLAFACIAAPLFTACSPPPRRIGFLSGGHPSSAREQEEAWNSLREFGWVVGKNLLVEYRFANLEFGQLASMAEELVRLKPDLIVAVGTAATRAAKAATATIPIVMASSSDPVASGLVASLARPGGNVTGYSSILADTAAKRAQFVHQALPNVQRVALLIPGPLPYPAVNARILEQTEASYRALGVETMAIGVAPPWGDIEFKDGVQEAVRRKAQAIEFVITPPPPIIEAATAGRLPLIAGPPESVDAGAVLALEANVDDRDRRVAAIIDKVLRGANPADIPVEQPTRFTLVINVKAAKALGIDIPQEVVLRADKVLR
jgi:putative ABC transport system substrate-binding protein